MYEMLLGVTPFVCSDQQRMYTNIKEAPVRIPGFVSSPAKTFIQGQPFVVPFPVLCSLPARFSFFSFHESKEGGSEFLRCDKASHMGCERFFSKSRLGLALP